MKKAYAVSIFCTLLVLCMAGTSLAQVTPGCDRGVTETARLQTARDLLEVDASNYASRVNYWAEDVVYREPVLTNHGREEMFDYLAAMFQGTIYGFPDDKVTTIKDELYHTDVDDRMTYIATMEWSGTFGTEFFIQRGMSIIKFDPGEGCPSYHRDYWTEGDTWWHIPSMKPMIDSFRGVYINMFLLTGRCFDDDFDGYTKYLAATGCPNAGLDCNDFVPGINPGATEIPQNGIDDDCNPETLDCADNDEDGYSAEGGECGEVDCDDANGNVNPGMTEIPENGLDDDCNPDTPDTSPPCGASASVVGAEYKGASDLASFLVLLFVPLGAVLVWSGLRRRR